MATIIKTFSYKIRATRAFTEAATRSLDASRDVYNAALEQRILHYRQGKPIGYFQQSRELTEARTLPEVGTCLRTIQEDALKRLDFAFKAFFKRSKAKKGKAGFPRFRNKARYSTFSQNIEKQRCCPLTGDTLTVPGVGSCRIRLSRPIEGKVKQLCITHKTDGWYALLVCEMDRPTPLPFASRSTGLDLGITRFATLSTGGYIRSPQYLRRAAKALKRSHQAFSRKMKRSANRAKARQRLALHHLRIQRARRDFHYKIASNLIQRFNCIHVEALRVANMIQSPHLAPSIGDAGWSQFLSILCVKAAWAGRVVKEVIPEFTSQMCSRCMKRSLPSKRFFVCDHCGLVLHRDHNAAINIGRGAPIKPAFALEVAAASRNRASA